MKAKDILQHFFSRGYWVDPNDCSDGIMTGDPEREIRTVLVTWMGGLPELRAAVEGGFDALITHEPTFWSKAAEDGCLAEGRDAGSPGNATDLAKRRYIGESGLVVIRNHDVWDRFPEVGIPWAWARFLGLGNVPAATGPKGWNPPLQHRYDIAPLTLTELVKKVAERTATIGEPLVQVVGDGDQVVSKVGIGTGCGCDIHAYMKMGCDVSIVCDDGSIYSHKIQQARDSGHPVIRVNHGTSEEPGMVTMAKYINENLVGVRAEHLPHGCCFRLEGVG